LSHDSEYKIEDVWIELAEQKYFTFIDLDFVKIVKKLKENNINTVIISLFEKHKHKFTSKEVDNIFKFMKNNNVNDVVLNLIRKTLGCVNNRYLLLKSDILKDDDPFVNEVQYGDNDEIEYDTPVELIGLDKIEYTSSSDDTSDEELEKITKKLEKRLKKESQDEDTENESQDEDTENESQEEIQIKPIKFEPFFTKNDWPRDYTAEVAKKDQTLLDDFMYNLLGIKIDDDDDDEKNFKEFKNRYGIEMDGDLYQYLVLRVSKEIGKWLLKHSNENENVSIILKSFVTEKYPETVDEIKNILTKETKDLIEKEYQKWVTSLQES
jgi:hypothetical protein